MGVQVCSGMFKCKGPRVICILLSSVCDRYKNCPHDDDESLCILANIKCIHECDCFGLAVMCKDHTNSLLTSIDHPYVSVYFQNVYNLELKAIKRIFPHTVFGIFLSNNISHICQTHLPFNMIYIDLGSNKILLFVQVVLDILSN